MTPPKPARTIANEKFEFFRFSRWSVSSISLFLILSISTVGTIGKADDAKLSTEQRHFFESYIRPLLSTHCFECHSEEKRKGGLLLTSRESAIRGGDSGPAIRPGDAEGSPLIEAVRYRNSDFQMPPKKKLSDREIAQLEQWIKMGAPWPVEESLPKLENSAFAKSFKITDEDRDYWAFKPIKRPALESPASQGPSHSPIDHFIERQLANQNLSPLKPANRRTLIRRAYFDLIGLPPSYQEVQDFERDTRPNAIERLIDRLLAMPQYGERYGRHWLDVVRFAQTNGYERDDEKPLAWKYRDYVIQSYNADKPFRDFVREQIAGDELDQPTRDSLIATGFFRLGVWDDEPDDRRAAEFDGLDDMIKTTSESFLGLTIGCARCHDHMFDPISQKDYYQFLSFFRNIRYYDRPQLAHNSATYLPLADPKLVQSWRDQLKQKTADAERIFQETSTSAREALINEKRAKLSDAVQAALKIPVAQRTPEQVELAKEAEPALNPSRKEIIDRLDPELRETINANEAALRQFETSPPWTNDDYALGVKEHGPAAPDTHLLIRGNAGRPSEKVGPQFLTVLTQSNQPIPQPKQRAQSSGRRRALADWIASAENPLTARVIVNRIWQHHFGRGLVQTPNDFGAAGLPPSHPALLDWLARDFIDHDWSIKRLHKQIMMSAAYQRASSPHPENEAIDPGNQSLWRQNLRRLEAEALRDSILVAANAVNPSMGGRGFFPLLSSEVVAGGSRPGRGWGYSNPSERNRRSVYTFIKRTMGVPLLEVFDYNNTEGSLGTRTTTTVAPQALTLLNDEFVSAQATQLARSLIDDDGSTLPGIVDGAFRRTLGRDPSEHERRVAREFLIQQQQNQETLQDQLAFRPDVPNSLERQFLNSLPSDRLLIPPNQDWQSYRGRWGSEYESILVADEDYGPFALWKPTPFHEGTVEGRVKFSPATSRTSILLNAIPYRDRFLGYELRVDHAQGTLMICRHTPNPSTLATIKQSFPPETWIGFTLQRAGGQLSAQFDGMKQALVIEDSNPLNFPGHLGIRSWGGNTHFDALTVKLADQSIPLSHTLVNPQSFPSSIRPAPDLPQWTGLKGRWELVDFSSILTDGRAESHAQWTGHELTPGSRFQANVDLSQGNAGKAGMTVTVGERQWDVSIDATDAVLVVGERNNDWRELSRHPIPDSDNHQYLLSLENNGTSLVVSLGKPDEEVASVPIPPNASLGLVGIKSWKAKVRFDQISWRHENQLTRYAARFNTKPTPLDTLTFQNDAERPYRESVRELCSLLFNLNEFIYID